MQDFCKESHEKADEKEDKLISIDFWEAYDPDEIFKMGFPLIGTEATNVRALCFLCGSAGLEKVKRKLYLLQYEIGVFGLIFLAFSYCTAFLVVRHIIGIVPKDLRHLEKKLN